jgi:hypothetical protein
MACRLDSNGSAGRASEAIDDARFVGVVGRHFDFDAVTDDEADEAFAHFAGDVGEDFVRVGKFDAEHGAGENGGYGTLEFDGGFLIDLDILVVAPTGETGPAASTGVAVSWAATTGAALRSFLGRRHSLNARHSRRCRLDTG